MDMDFAIKTIVGHLVRLLTPATLYLFAKMGFDAVESQGFAADAAPALAALVGVVISAVWSYRSRKALRDQASQ